MQYREIAQTGVKASQIGLGTVKFGRNTNVKYPAGFNLPSDKDILEILAIAKDYGVNLIDTAPAYGNSESRLGKLLRKTRSQWIISTKVGEIYRDGSSTFDYSPEAIKQSIDASLQALATDYLDIVLIHSNGDDVRIIEEYGALSTLQLIQRTGKIRAVGMSVKSIPGGILTLDQADLAMVTWNRSDQSQIDVLTHAQQIGKSIVVKKSLNSGLLVADGHADWLGKALRFALEPAAVSSVILGTINKDHWRRNLQTYEKLIAAN